MARHDDDYRFRSYSSREDRGSHRDSMSGSRAGWRSTDDDHDDRERFHGSFGGGRYGSEREDQGSSRWFGPGSRENDGRYGGYEGERGDAYRGGSERGGRHDNEYGYGGGSYGRGNYEQDDMSSGGVAGGGRGYGYGPGNGGDMYRGRGGTLGSGMSDEMGGSHSQGMGRQSMGGYAAGGQGTRGGLYGGRSGGMSGSNYGSGHGGGAGRYGSEHAGVGGGYGIASSGQEHHGGKGPKGYTRSDDRIKEDVCDCLTDDPMLDAGEIEVQVKNGEVTLSGTVSDRLAKRHAEDMIERVSGVKNVQNSIRVKGHDTSGAQSGSQNSMRAGK